MLMDKGFYDYDYKVIEKPQPTMAMIEDLPDYEQTQRFFAKLGFGIYAEGRDGKRKESKPVSDMNIEELQEYAIKQLNEK